MSLKLLKKATHSINDMKLGRYFMFAQKIIHRLLAGRDHLIIINDDPAVNGYFVIEVLELSDWEAKSRAYL
jgi:hypothetical protein